MHRFSVIRCVGLLACIATGFGCGKTEETAVTPTGPIVNVLDLAVSLRSGASAPSDAIEVELASNALNVAGQGVLTLTDGRFAPGDQTGDTLPKLTAALGKKQNMVLSVGSSVPYSSAAAVLATAKAAGVNNVSFKVRAPGATSNTGLLTLENFSVRPKTKNDEEVAIPGAPAKPWSAFATQWEAVHEACRASPTGNCAYKPELIAEGGNLKLVLHAAGQGANVAFYRTGEPPPPPPPPPAAATKKGKKGKASKTKSTTVDPVAELEQAPPATEAGFQFRSQEATNATSAISGTVRPVCGTSACGVAVQGEKGTLFVRILSLIGAAFPDGTPAPIVAFELP